MFKGLDHVNINTDRLEETLRFYIEVLGFEIAPRPDMGVPGYWLGHGGRDFIHLMSFNPPGGAGPVDHFAIAIEDVGTVRKHLDGKGVPYGEFSFPDGSRSQLTIKDPNGVTVELNWRAG